MNEVEWGCGTIMLSVCPSRRAVMGACAGLLQAGNEVVDCHMPSGTTGILIT